VERLLLPGALLLAVAALGPITLYFSVRLLAESVIQWHPPRAARIRGRTYCSTAKIVLALRAAT
jgi:hypothetical protein